MRYARAIRKIAYGLLAVVALLAIWDVSMGVRVFVGLRSVSQSVESLKVSWNNRRWGELSQEVAHAREGLRSSFQSLDRMVIVPRLPWIKADVVAIKNLAGAWISIADGAEHVLNSKLASVAPLFEGVRDLSRLSVADRRAIQSALTASIPAIDVSARSFANAGVLLGRIPLNADIFESSAIRTAYEMAHTTSSVFGSIEPLVTLAPHLMGFDGEQVYLMLFQNDTELRPTGGFIGTYGILTVRDGRVVNFIIDDTYNLDDRAPKKTRPIAPEPIQQYLGQSQWYLRDVNWSPDFPETAVRALQFYREEGGVGVPNAVVAMTTRPLVDFLKMTGPVTVGGSTFTSENVVDTLQAAVELEYPHRGIPVTERKRIVGTLGQALTQRMQALSPYEVRDVLRIIRSNLDAKQILLYDKDVATQRAYAVRNWAGAVSQTTADYLMVVDSNLGSLKTDPAVARAIDYRVSKDNDGRLVADVRLTYDHSGNFTWKTTRLKNYVRIYVPRGSVLISGDGFMVREKSNIPGNVSTATEFGRMVFAGFVVVEPGEKRQLHLTYVLPDGVLSATPTATLYQLYVQKQPGSGETALRVLAPGNKVLEWAPQSSSARTSKEGAISWDTTLTTDQAFSVVWKE